MSPSKNIDDLQAWLFQFASAGDFASLALILSENSLSREQCSLVLACSAANGRAQCVKLLIPLSDPTADESVALFEAARNGHADCVKLLIPVSDHTVYGASAFYAAAENGHAECARLLTPSSRLRIADSRALCEASILQGNPDVLAIMLAHDQRLLNGSILNGQDLSVHLDSALGKGHAGLASLLSSIIERQALSKTVPIADIKRSLRLGARL